VLGLSWPALIPELEPAVPVLLRPTVASDP
jgi:hypothetical protein